MALNQQHIGKKYEEETSPVSGGINTTGIFVGQVKAINSDQGNGSLKVYIKGMSAVPESDPLNWLTVNYASPFMGQTTGASSSYGANDYLSTHQTYGMFMVPPDLGNLVLCCFPGGNTDVGYWFACISDKLSRQTQAAVASDFIDPSSIPKELSAIIGQRTERKYPASNFTQNANNAFSSDWKKIKKPIDFITTMQLFRTGLIDDPERGAISSTLNRDDVPSVFSIHTPGRSIQDFASIPELADYLNKKQLRLGEINTPVRTPGHSFIMDDGSALGENKLVRLRTAGGHQIILNDTENCVYISNANGLSWIELAASGEILAYSHSGIAMRSQGPIQYHSDAAIIMDAPVIQLHGSKGIIADGKAVQIQGQDGVSIKGQSVGIEGTTSASLTSSGSTSLGGGAITSCSAAGILKLDGALTTINSGGGGVKAAVKGALSNALKLALGGGNNMKLFSHADTTADTNGWSIKDNSFQSAVTRAPSHEPWIRGSVGREIERQEQALKEGVYYDEDGNPISADELKNKVQTVAGQSVTATPAPRGEAIDNTSGVPPKAAGNSVFRKQPETQSLGALSSNQMTALFAQTGYTESGGNYSVVNTIGYVGKYQLGGAALYDRGLITQDALQKIRANPAAQAEILGQPSSWQQGSGKPGSLDSYLADSSLQESVMYEYTQQNYATLQKLGVITRDTPADEVAGLLSASHLSGPGNVAKWYKGGSDLKDAYGTSISQYYANGRYAATSGASVVTAASNAKSTATG